MYSPEFMKFLIKYQSNDEVERSSKKVIRFGYSFKYHQLASVLLTTKK